MAYFSKDRQQTAARLLSCSILYNRKHKNDLTQWTGTADDFAELLRSHAHKVSYTAEQYFKLTDDEQKEVKDTGGFIGGTLEDNSRAKFKKCLTRDFLTVDLDNVPDMQQIMNDLDGLQCFKIIYSTIKHTPAAPRLRVIIPLQESISPETYAAVCRSLLSVLQYDKGIADLRSCQPKQFMYWPTSLLDIEPIFQVRGNGYFDALQFLAIHPDPQEAERQRQNAERAERTVRQDARFKDNAETQGKSTPDFIGAFNRTYTVLDVIRIFNLPYEVKQQLQNGDYLLEDLRGSAAGGVYYYPRQNLLYTFHSTSADSGSHSLSPFELVRIHVYGGSQTDTKTGMHDMALLCANDSAVCSNANDTTRRYLSYLWHKENDHQQQAKTMNDFDDIGDSDQQEGSTNSQNSDRQSEDTHADPRPISVTLENVFDSLRPTTPRYMAQLYLDQGEGVSTALKMYYEIGRDNFRPAAEPLTFKGLTVNCARTSGGKTLLQTALITYLLQHDTKAVAVVISLEESEPAMYARIMANYARSYQYEEATGSYWTHTDAVSIANVKQWLTGSDILSFKVNADGKAAPYSDSITDKKRDLLERCAVETADRLQIVSRRAFLDAKADIIQACNDRGGIACFNDNAKKSIADAELIAQFIRYRRKQIEADKMHPIFFIDYAQKMKQEDAIHAPQQWQLIKAVMDVLSEVSNEGATIFLAAQMNREIAKEAKNDKWTEFKTAYCEQIREGADIDHAAEMILYSTIVTDPNDEKSGKLLIKTMKHRSGTHDLYAMADIDFNSVFADLAHWQAPIKDGGFKSSAKSNIKVESNFVRDKKK